MKQEITIGARIAETGGRATGFDYMRLVLATAIVLWHVVVTSYGQDAQRAAAEGPFRPLIAILLPLFFALSGFLVAGSLERSKSLFGFLGLRVIRIFPALIVEVTLSALVLGPLLTTLPLDRYIHDPMFRHYFWNMLGHIHYTLPGLFPNNPNPNVVNGQLWTVPYELYCYISLAALAVLGLARRRALFVVATIGLIILRFVQHWLRHPDGALRQVGAVSGTLLVMTFLAAVAVYLYRDKLPWSRRWALVSAAVTVAALAVIPQGDYLVPFPAAYLTVYLGLMNPPKVGLLQGADYSYGMFLYGYPIQQAVASLGGWAHHWYINILICLPLAVGFAAFSWHVVEKPALSMRKPLMAAEGVYIRFRQRAISAIVNVASAVGNPR